MTLVSDNGPSIFFQIVPEGKAVKNRIHMNLHADDRISEVKRLIGLGATEVDVVTVEGYSWTNMEDVEGNEFCVSQPA